MTEVQNSPAVETETDAPAVETKPRPKPKAKPKAEKAEKVEKAKPAKAKKAKPKAEKSKKAKPKAAKAERSSDGGLSPNQVKVLKALKGTSAGGKELSRAQIKKVTGIKSGLYRLMGAATMEDWGTADAESALEPAGYIKSFTREGQRGLTYAITAKGKKALDDIK